MDEPNLSPRDLDLGHGRPHRCFVHSARAEEGAQAGLPGQEPRALRSRFREHRLHEGTHLGLLGRGEAEALLQERPQRFTGTTPEGLALVVVSLIQGYALLVIKEPDRADAETVLRTVAVLVEPY